MRKKLLLLTTVMALGIMLTGCGHEHTWVEATCTDPMTCSECGATEGEALGHVFSDATCTEAKTCSVCGETEGSALGHTWVDATYEEPKTCSVCGETEGEPLEKTVEYLLKNEYSEVYDKLKNTCEETVQAYSDYYNDIRYEISGNEISIVYVLLDGVELNVAHFETEEIQEGFRQALEAETNSIEEYTGKRPDSVGFVYLSNDEQELYKYTYTD